MKRLGTIGVSWSGRARSMLRALLVVRVALCLGLWKRSILWVDLCARKILALAKGEKFKISGLPRAR